MAPTTSTNNTKKSVSFQEENDILTFECHNHELSKELFYQPEDYSQFRKAYRSHKRRQDKQSANVMEKLNLVRARNELMMKEGPKIGDQTATIVMPIIGTPVTRRVPRSSLTHRGCALMA